LGINPARRWSQLGSELVVYVCACTGSEHVCVCAKRVGCESCTGSEHVVSS